MKSRIQTIQNLDILLKTQFLAEQKEQEEIVQSISSSSTNSPSDSPSSPEPAMHQSLDSKSSDEEELLKPDRDKKYEEEKALENAYFEWLKEQNSVEYMQFIELVSKELEEDFWNTIVQGNHFIHFIAIVIATMTSSTAYALEASGDANVAFGVISTGLEFTLEKIAMPIAIITLITGGLMDTREAYKDEDALDRTFVMAEGLYRAALGVAALLISLGAFAASPIVLPSLFLAITLGMAVKEYRQYNEASKKISILEEENKEEKAQLTFFKENNPEQHKLEIQKLEMRIAKREERIEILKVQRESAKKSGIAILSIGLPSIAFFFAFAVATAAFPPLAPLFMAIGLLLFLTLNRTVNHIKSNAHEEIESIKLKKRYEEPKVKTVKTSTDKITALQKISGLSIFAKHKKEHAIEMTKIKEVLKAPVAIRT